MLRTRGISDRGRQVLDSIRRTSEVCSLTGAGMIKTCNGRVARTSYQNSATAMTTVG